MIALYPVLVYTPNDMDKLESIIHEFGLLKQKLFPTAEPLQWLRWINDNVDDEEMLQKSLELYQEQRSSKRDNNIQSSTFKIFNSSTFDRWLKSINDLDYKHVYEHYCCDDVLY